MPYIDGAKLAEFKEQAQRAVSRFSGFKEKLQEEMGFVKSAVEVNLTALGTGYAWGKWGGAEKEIKVLGIPLDLGLGIVMHGAAFADAFGKKYAEDGHNVGNGFTAHFFARFGQRLGSESASSSTASGAYLDASGYAGPAQLGPANSSGAMGDAELRSVLESVSR